MNALVILVTLGVGLLLFHLAYESTARLIGHLWASIGVAVLLAVGTGHNWAQGDYFTMALDATGVLIWLSVARYDAKRTVSL